MKKYTKEELIEKLKTLELLSLDVDGTLTDGSMYLDEKNVATKKFYAHDGTGLSMIKQLGIKVALVSTSISPILAERAKILKIEHCIIGSYDKGTALSDLCKSLNINKDNTIHMGDDINDILAFQNVGIPIAVNNCVDVLEEFVCYKTKKNGGSGAVREICDLIMLAKTGKLYGLPYVDLENFVQ